MNGHEVATLEKQSIVVLCTCPDRGIAELIAETLVGERLAACVNILPEITSIYRWEGRQQHDRELLLVIKTAETLYAELEGRIRALHPYQVVEVIALPIRKGAADYLDWIHASVGTPP
jgi:periplasmic divalent cation tolerance protein